MLNTIITLNDDVAQDLQTKIREFGKTGLQAYQGENVETARVDIMAMATCLLEKGLLHKEAVDSVLKELTKASHKEFAKVFQDFNTMTKSTLLSSTTTFLPGTNLEKIERLWDEAVVHCIIRHMS